MAEKTRRRINGTYRWSEHQTTELLTLIVEAVKSNPDLFENPTAQKFYARISSTAPAIAIIKWDIMRSKMQHLKNSYLSALKWKSQTGSGLLENGEAKSVKEYLKKICPYYNYLEAIFGQRINIHPPAIYQSSQSVVF